MKSLLLAAVAAMTLAGVSSANSVNTAAGSNSLVFSFNGLSSLGVSGYSSGNLPGTNLNITGVGYRMGMGDGTAIRTGLTFGRNSTTVKSGQDGVSDAKSSQFAFGLDGVLEKYLTESGQRVQTYVGVGAGLGYASSSTEPPLADNPPNGATLKTTQNAFSFGVSGVAGFRAGIFDNLDLGGEYSLGLGLSSTGGEVESQGVPNVDFNEGSNFNFGTGVASLYMSVAWG